MGFQINQYWLEQLVDRVRQDRVVPFVGAGLSVQFGRPAWRDFLLNQARSLGRFDSIVNLLEKGEYETAAEELERHLPGSFREAIVNTFGLKDVANCDAAAINWLPKIWRKTVFTTNFDHVLQQTYHRAAMPFEWVLRSRSDIELLKRAQTVDEHGLIKLHGDADDETRVLTSSEYELAYGSRRSVAGEDKPLPRVLRHLFAKRSVFFVGCGLQADRFLDVLADVYPLLSEIERKVPGLLGPASPRHHFALMPEPVEPQAGNYQQLKSDRAEALGNVGIRVIWYQCDRHHEVGECLGFIHQQASGQVVAPTYGAGTVRHQLAKGAPLNVRSLLHRLLEAGDPAVAALVNTGLDVVKHAGAWPPESSLMIERGGDSLFLTARPATVADTPPRSAVHRDFPNKPNQAIVCRYGPRGADSNPNFDIELTNKPSPQIVITEPRGSRPKITIALDA